MKALGTWGERWMELVPEHLDPGVRPGIPTWNRRSAAARAGGSAVTATA